MNNPMMNQTYKVLKEIAKAENVPYSRTNKATLVNRIQHYRDTVGTLYRESKMSLKRMAKKEGIRKYGTLKKGDLIDTILFHRRVIKPQIEGLRKLRKGDLRQLARASNVPIIGGKKDRIAHNIATHRTRGLRGIMEDIVGEEYKAREEQGAFGGNFRKFRSKGVDEGKTMTIDEYLAKTRRHIIKVMKDLIRSGQSWKFQLNIAPEFVHIQDENDKCIKGLWSNNFNIMMGSNLEEIADELIRDLLAKYEILSQKLDSSSYVFRRIFEMSYHSHRGGLQRGSSYIISPNWLAVKKAVINPKNEDEQCFKWAVIAALHHKEINSHPERITNLTYYDRYNWDGIKFPTPSNQWSKFERQNPEVALNVLFVDGESKIEQAYISKFNSIRPKIADVLIIQQGVKTHYVAIKNLSRLLRGVTSTNNGDFYCRNCLKSFRTKTARDDHVGPCMDHEFCNVIMPDEGENILYYKEGEKSIRVPFVMYGDLEAVLEPVLGVEGNPDQPFEQDVNRHVPCGAALYTKFAHGELKRSMMQHRGEDCVKVFCKTMKERVYQAVRYKKKGMDL